jgi:hypothetical protein
VRAGAFIAYPKLETDVAYNDNIYAVTTAPASDVIWRLKPAYTIQSNWSRHSASFYANASINRYTSHSAENTNDWAVGSDDRLDFARNASLSLGGEASELTEPRTSSSVPADAAKPVQYGYDDLYLGVQKAFSRWRLTARGDWTRFDYYSVPSVTGGIINENDRDHIIGRLLGRADYAVSPDTALFVQVSGDWRNYRLPGTPQTPSRDSSGYEALAGANFDVTALIRGEIGVGYLSENFKSAAYRRASGLGVRGNLDWFVTELTTVNLQASRTVNDSGIEHSAGYLATNVGARVDHELLRNVIVTAGGQYSHSKYNGIDRADDDYSANAGVTYFMNRHVGVNAYYSYLKQNSSGLDAGSSFTVNQFSLGLVLQY